MVRSQFGSPEALAPEQGKSLGSLIVEILFYCPESNLSIQRRRDSLPSSGEYRARWHRSNFFGLSGGRWDDSIGTKILKS